MENEEATNGEAKEETTAPPPVSEKEVRKVRDRLSKATAELEGVKAKCDGVSARIQTMTAEAVRLEDAHAEASASAALAGKQGGAPDHARLEKLEREIQAERSTLRTMTRRWAEAAEAVRQAALAVAEIDTAVERQTIPQVEARIAALQSQLTELNASIPTHQQRITGLERDAAEFKSDVSRIGHWSGSIDAIAELADDPSATVDRIALAELARELAKPRRIALTNRPSTSIETWPSGVCVFWQKDSGEILSHFVTSFRRRSGDRETALAAQTFRDRLPNIQSEKCRLESILKQGK